MNDSYGWSAAVHSGHFHLFEAYLLVNVQLPEDLCCIKQVVLLEDPALC